DNESSFESKLNMAAAYAIDRVRLFELINGVEAGFHLEKQTLLIASGDEKLDELLRSIHDKKSQVLSTLNLDLDTNGVDDDAELLSMEELKPSGSEYAPPANQIAEENETYS